MMITYLNTDVSRTDSTSDAISIDVIDEDTRSRNLKNEDDVLTLARRKSNSSRLYRMSSTYPRVVTCSPPDGGAARYQQFTSCLLEGLYQGC